MSDTQQLLARQAEWQRGRATLTWPEKIRMAERVRESVLRLRRSRQPATAGPRPTLISPEPNVDQEIAAVRPQIEIVVASTSFDAAPA